MLPYIATNPVTDTIKQNTETAYQRAEKMHMIDQARQRDAALRQGAQIYAEPAPVAPAPITTFKAVPQAGPPAPPTVNMAGNPNPTVPLPDIQQPSVTYPPAPADTRGQRALQVFSNTPGMGDVAMNVAQHNQTLELAQREKMSAHTDKVLELISNGNIQGAKQYAQVHGITAVLPWFDNPRALVTVGSLGRAAHAMGADWSEASNFTEKTLSGMSQGLSSEDAQREAYRGLVPKIQGIVQDNNGNITGWTRHGVTVPMGKGGKTKTLPQGRDPATAKNVQRTFVGSNGFMWAILKNGEAKQLVDPNGDPVKSNEMNKFAGQLYLKNADMPGASIENAKGVAEQLYNPSTPSVGKTLDFVPGQGFVPSAK